MLVPSTKSNKVTKRTSKTLLFEQTDVQPSTRHLHRLRGSLETPAYAHYQEVGNVKLDPGDMLVETMAESLPNVVC